MKHLKKLLAAALATFMALVIATPAYAAATADSGKGGSASITITLPTDNAGTNEEITYTVYKVFDATSDGTTSAISYKIDATNGELSAAMTAAGFAVDGADNVSGPASLDADAIAAIAAYAKDSIGTFKAKPSDGTLQITGLEYGYYYITTTTGSVVTVDSTNPNAEVNDKNTIPGKPDKKITGASSYDEDGQKALAQVGTDVKYTVTIKKVAGATNYVFHDVMDSRLSYNNDVKVTPADVVKSTETAEGDTITVTFDNDKLAALEDNTDITITYSAKITAEALSEDPAKNTATLDYGEGHTTDKDETEVYTAKFTVTKQDDQKKPLAGAGFVVKNADNKYYKLDNGVVTWVDSIDNATEYTSDAEGKVTAFTGLANGTYTLVEKTVPAGYNKAADSTFTIAEHDYTATNLEQAKTVENKSGTELPSTGGMGTTLFYIVGGLMVAGAAIALIAKNRVAKMEA